MSLEWFRGDILGKKNFGCLQSSRADVIDFCAARQKLVESETRTIYYLSETGESLAALQSLNLHSVKLIRSTLDLSEAESEGFPEIILIEGQLEWSCGIELIKFLEEKYQVPIVMICDSTKDARINLKQAFSAGVCDTLASPLDPQELFETISVLLKFQQVNSKFS